MIFTKCLFTREGEEVSEFISLIISGAREKAINLQIEITSHQ